MSDENLNPDQIAIARHEATERPFSSPLNYEKRDGLYHCAACDTPLFSSEHKYDSGSGWPSYYTPISSEVIGNKTDHRIGMERTEVHCNKCGAHLGHVFDDGPKPTGKRYCINGLVLRFAAQ